MSVWVVRWVNTTSSPRALELLAQASATSQTSLVTPLQVLADICPHPSPSQAGRAPGAGSAQGCRCVGSASTTLGSPSCHQPGASLWNSRHGENFKGKSQLHLSLALCVTCAAGVGWGGAGSCFSCWICWELCGLCCFGVFGHRPAHASARKSHL